MHIKISRHLIIAFFLLSIISQGCTKVDTTQLGADLIPAVDNVFTFADTLAVVASRERLDDSIRLGKTENHILGRINDPVFGNKNANIFVQFKPSFFPYYYGNAKDTILAGPVLNGFDSVILCLSYKGFYGDTSIAQNIKVYELNASTSNFKDSFYLLNFQPDMPYLGNLIGQQSVKASDLATPVFFNRRKDSVTNQIRIKLSDNFSKKLRALDTTAGSLSTDDVLRSDSAYKALMKGIAIVSDNGTAGTGGIFYISLTDPATRLEIHYAKKNGVQDTVFSTYTVATGASFSVGASAAANQVIRDSASSEFTSSPNANALYVQTAPGSAIGLNIPELTGYPNRIIHRAELFLDQLVSNPLTESILTPPDFLYLDLIDTSSALRYKPVYFDLSPGAGYNPDDRTTNAANFFPSTGIDYNYFGGFQRKVSDASGVRSFYTFNLTRYVQNIVTRKGVNYKIRISAPYILTYNGLNFPFSNRLAAGRVKLAGPTNSNINLRMRMRIIYSNLP